MTPLSRIPLGFFYPRATDRGHRLILKRRRDFEVNAERNEIPCTVALSCLVWNLGVMHWETSSKGVECLQTVF